MKTPVTQHNFAKVPPVKKPRSSFDRSSRYTTTFDADYLIPFFVDEALPGDTWNLNANIFARIATPLKPVMDNIFLETFWFAVPERILWENWERFNGAQDDPLDSISFLMPTVDSGGGGFALGSIADYFGIPLGAFQVSPRASWFRGYNRIWNDWFRDENLQDSVTVNIDDGPDPQADYVLLKRGKRHDYFTSCLPYLQKGPAVQLPLGSSADVTSLAADVDIISDGTNPTFTASGNPNEGLRMTAASTTSPIGGITGGGAYVVGNTMAWGNSTGMKLPTSALIGTADLSTATAATIAEIMQATQIQALLWQDVRGGTRYTELVLSHFGVQSSDARLQRAELLSLGRSMVNIHPVPQTSVAAATPQGNLSAFGTSSDHIGSFTKSFEEHCIIIGLVAARADQTYQQGLDRMWSRSTRYDFYWPALSQIGEQSVLSKEIYYDGTVDDEDVFGYQERYGEYRYKPSRITGLFRSNVAGSLDLWHLSQDFSARPLLDDTFIESNTPIDRVIAVPSEPHFLLDANISLKCARPMPMYGVPQLGSRF